jgi:hypothetical protein
MTSVIGVEGPDYICLQINKGRLDKATMLRDFRNL